jgi:hypothetical protein
VSDRFAHPLRTAERSAANWRALCGLLCIACAALIAANAMLLSYVAQDQARTRVNVALGR